MFKAMILLSRRDDMTHEEFVHWWVSEHRLLAAQLPGVRRIVFNVVAQGADESGIDGVAELWFDTREDFDAAYATEVGQKTAADSLAHVSSRVRLLTDEHVILSS